MVISTYCPTVVMSSITQVPNSPPYILYGHDGMMQCDWFMDNGEKSPQFR